MSEASSPTGATRLAAAIKYCARGYAVLPVPTGQKSPGFAGWQKFRCPVADISEHFSGPGNVGILLGEPSGGLVDVDLDCTEALELADKFLPPTPVTTGRRSTPTAHRWYIARGAATKQYRDPVSNEMIVELRSTGGQTLVGPSIHPDTGEEYQVLAGEPAEVDAAHLAASVCALAAEITRRRYPDRPLQLALATPVTPTTQPISGDPALERASAYLDAMPGAISGQGGHARTYAAAVAVVHGFGIDPETAFRLLWDRYNPRCEPPWTEKELRHKVDDAATKPHDRPRLWLLDADRNVTDGSDLPVHLRLDQPHIRNGLLTTHAAEVPSESLPPHLPLTDLGNAERLERAFEPQLRFCPASGKWLVWTGKQWKIDDQNTPLACAATVARNILDEARNAPSQKLRKALAKWALKSEFSARLQAMVTVAESLPRLVVTTGLLDADRWALNVNNGTIDLRTGELRPHRRENYITKLAPVDYDPRATCPLFEKFLDRIFAGKRDLIAYVQRLLGMALTGDISEQILPIFHGDGGNGKSVLLDTAKGIMGDYATDAPPTLLMNTKHQEHPTEIADLWGRRLVVASETEQGAALKLQRVKRLTGDDTLKGRFMRQDFFSFPRTHKTIMVTNNKPRIRETTEAAWRRVKLVPFTVIIPKEERDKHLMEKLRAERSGILSWLVRGCLDWQCNGLGEPPEVVEATARYKGAEDIVGRFLEECCIVDASDKGLFTSWKTILRTINGWAETNGERAPSARALQEILDQRGFPSETRRVSKTDVVKGRVGIHVKRPESDLPV